MAITKRCSEPVAQTLERVNINMPTWIHNLLFEPSVIIAMTGTGVVLLALLALQWTRWGQDNPVAKCVILSILAHITLLAYAYSLNLGTPLALRKLEPVVPIRVADEPLQDETTLTEPTETAFWERIPDSEPALSDTPLAEDASDRPDRMSDPTQVPQPDRIVTSDAEKTDFASADPRAESNWQQLVASTDYDSTSNDSPTSRMNPFEAEASNSIFGGHWLDDVLQPAANQSNSPQTKLVAEATAIPEITPPPPTTRDAQIAVDPNQLVQEQWVENLLTDSGLQRPTSNIDRSTLPDTLGGEVTEQALAQEAGQEAEWVESLTKELDRWTEQTARTPNSEISPSMNDVPSEATAPVVNTDGVIQIAQSQSNTDSSSPFRGNQASLNASLQPRPTADQWQLPDRTSAQNMVMAQRRRQAVALRAGDQQPLPNIYRFRQNRQPEEVETAGGSSDTEMAAARGLVYLADKQQADGGWNPRETGGGREQQILGHNRQGAGAQADTGITGLALLAFLADGNSHLDGPYRETVQRGLEFLLQRQQRNGSLAGKAQYYAQMYCHSMALLAISEAYALTGDYRLRPAVEAGVAFSQDTQNRAGGGWRYQPQEAGDMSQFGWQLMALRSAQTAQVEIDPSTRVLMERFLQRHTRGTAGGLAIYRLGEAVSPTITAEALFSRYLLQQNPGMTQAEEACREILGVSVSDQQPKFANDMLITDCRHLPGQQIDNLYFWYYASLALKQASADQTLATSDVVQQSWELWNRNLTTRLLSLQVVDGADKGSWPPESCLWGGYGGRVYTTSLAVLCLQVYYRYDLQPEATVMAQVPWSATPIGPAPLRGPASGSLQDLR